MPITGSQKALMQCRSGIERAGATRTGYFTPNAVITINGTDRTSYILVESLRVTLNLHNEPNECFFQIKPGSGFTPTAGHHVIVGLGTATNRVFAGQILTVGLSRSRGHVPTREFITVRCADWTKLLDRVLITKTYTDDSIYTVTSVTAVVRDIISTYTSDFTANRVEDDLETVTKIEFLSETVSGALTKLARLIKGYWYVDADRDVHFWFTADPHVGGPQELSETNHALEDFEVTHDFSQIRTRVIAEGAKTKAMIDVPAGETSIPIEVGWGFPSSGTPNPPWTSYIRVVTQVLLYGSVTHLTGPPAALVTSTAVAGATSINIDSSTGFETDGWAHDAGGNLFKYANVTATSLTGIPASGYGAITADIESGTPIYEQDHLELAATLDTAIYRGDEIAYRVVYDDTTAQAAIAAIEGGDGIHDFALDYPALPDGSIITSSDPSAHIAQVLVDVYGAALDRARWTTRDMAAMPGRLQSFNFASPAYSNSLTITRVELSWVKQNLRPIRACQAEQVVPNDFLHAVDPNG